MTVASPAGGGIQFGGENALSAGLCLIGCMCLLERTWGTLSVWVGGTRVVGGCAILEGSQAYRSIQSRD